MSTSDTFPEQAPGLLSIGHSNHAFDDLVKLLKMHRVEAVADVRSSPHSGFNPQFNRQDLRHGLKAAGIRYVFLGEELGGRPEGAEFYDSDSRIQYGRVAETVLFQSGLRRLVEAGNRYRTAILCSEEDPVGCHRYLLITRALSNQGVEVIHIRGDGALQRPQELPSFDPEYREATLFGEEVRSSWRSTRSASPRSRPKTSSRR